MIFHPFQQDCDICPKGKHLLVFIVISGRNPNCCTIDPILVSTIDHLGCNNIKWIFTINRSCQYHYIQSWSINVNTIIPTGFDSNSRTTWSASTSRSNYIMLSTEPSLTIGFKLLQFHLCINKTTLVLGV